MVPKIQRILKEAGIQLYHSSENKLFRSLCTHKDSVNEFQKPGVYRIPCECGLVYIDETGLSLSLRLKERKINCEKAELEKSAVAKHSWTNDYRIKWNEASILATESHKFSRKMRESIEIEKHSTIDQEGKPLDQGAYNRAAQRLTFLRSTCDAGSSLGRVVFLINLIKR